MLKIFLKNISAKNTKKINFCNDKNLDIFVFKIIIKY